MPVSYKVLEQDKMPDAVNIVTNQKLLELRPGTSRYNSTAINSGAQLNSVSFFKDNSGNKHVLAKSQGSLYSVSQSSSHTLLSSAFTSNLTDKHRAVTFRGRHLIAMGSAGLYQYNGTTFTQLGQASPNAPTVAASGSGGTLPTSSYQVAYTFYDSVNGFETNLGAASSDVAITLGEKIDVTAMATTAANANIDKKRIYVKDVTNNSAWLFWAEIDLADASDIINLDITSTDTPPTTSAPHISGGAKYIKIFGDQVVTSGNTNFPSDVFFGTPNVPDAFDDTTTGLTLNAQGNGPVTGIGVGFYNTDATFPFLCIFKRNSIELYNTVNGQSTISENVGCVSGDTIKEINGAIFFMSTKGWHVVANGKLLKNKDNDAYDLADGDVNDIFTRPGYEYALAKSQLKNAFSVYYPTLNQYMTFVAESGSSDFRKSYNYELNISGFRPYKFPLRTYDATLAENDDEDDIVLFAVEGGYILKHSVNELKRDVKADGTTQAIESYFQFGWQGGDDMDATYNFGQMILRALRSDTPISGRYYKNFKFEDLILESYDMTEAATGFILDESMLDVDILSDGRNIVDYHGSIYQTAKSLLIQFLLNTEDSNYNIIEAQLDISKNGAPTK